MVRVRVRVRVRVIAHVHLVTEELQVHQDKDQPPNNHYHGVDLRDFEVLLASRLSIVLNLAEL